MLKLTKICAAVLALLMLFVFPAAAEEREFQLSSAENMLLLNLDTSAVLYKKYSGGKIAPGPAVKIMTGLVAAARLKDRMGETVTVTRGMLIGKVDGARMGLSEGDKLTVRDLLHSAVSGGYSDAAYALAVVTAGSESGFVAAMNARAATLNMDDTRFANPTGLDDEEMLTTMEDLVKLCRAALDNLIFMEACSSALYTFTVTNGEKTRETKIFSRNALLSEYYAEGYLTRGARGMIAGMTDAAGYCAVTSGTYSGANYLAIVMGAEERNGKIYSFENASELLTYAAQNFCIHTAMKKGDYVCDVKINNTFDKGDEGTVGAVLSEDLLVFMRKSDIGEKELQGVTFKHYLYFESFDGPLEAGTPVGGIVAVYEGKIVASVTLLAEKDVHANGFLSFMEGFRKAVGGRRTIIFLLVSAVVFPAYLYADKYIFGKTKQPKNRKPRRF